MTKKATPKIYFILLLLFILLTGCSDKKASESAVSPEAEAVAAVNNTQIAVKDISLDSKTDDSETVLVTFKINKEEMVEKIYFSYDQDGLIKDVYPINFK